jgi:hypothetical protein
VLFNTKKVRNSIIIYVVLKWNPRMGPKIPSILSIGSLEKVKNLVLIIIFQALSNVGVHILGRFSHGLSVKIYKLALIFLFN